MPFLSFPWFIRLGARSEYTRVIKQYGSDKPKFLRRDATEANADAAGSVASLQGYLFKKKVLTELYWVIKCASEE